ncbi:group 1 glycosyl transferase [Exiguobacterium sp. SH31]|uniref:glycosyltransferase n=1 Tax=Exiguobacterium sp. SH31 TaxID=1843183 RepID=UPI0008C61C54|nr:glycosyltransferase [Exiguobacterium sp. SH31]OGX79686.1 group 1 glycosyl transferase [Exiguobacterium sp. SH31]
MKILHINAINDVKSTGRICKELASVHHDCGHETRVAHSTGPVTEASYVIGDPVDVKLHALHARITGRQGYGSKLATENLVRDIERYAPDVVHLHNLHANYVHLRTLFEYLATRDIPTVLTLHDCWFFTGKCTHYTTVGCNKWQHGCGDCPQLKDDIPSWLFDRTSEMLDDKRRWLTAIPRLAVVGVSDWITTEARFSFLQHATVLRRIHNWVDLDVFRPVDATELRARLQLADKMVLLGVASTWSEAKGLGAFLDLAAARPNDAFLLIGRLGATELPANVIHVNEMNDARELARYYALADVFLNLSEQESFGNVTVEAMACGTPVLVLDATASPELVTDDTGVVVATRGLADLNYGIERIFARGKRSYKDACVTQARTHFALRDRAIDYLDVYATLRHEKVRNIL